MRPALVLLLAALSPASPAFGWGKTGHELVARTAVELLASRRHPMARFLEANADSLKRFALLPDLSWKDLDRREESLHYFEVDAFMAAEKGAGAIMLLPRGDYPKVEPRYRGLLAANAAFVKRYSPDKPLEPAAHGTSPWRLLQLRDLAVARLRADDAAGALAMLGAMGHAAGDLAEPFHATVDFNGAAHAPPAAGIHRVFEDRVIEKVSDKAVRQAAVAALARRGLGPVPRGEVLAEAFGLVSSGYPLVEPLLAAFARRCAAARARIPDACAPPGRRKPADLVPRSVAEGFYDDPLDLLSDKGLRKTTVREAAAVRLGEASAVLARLWASAFADAGAPPGLAGRFAPRLDKPADPAYPAPDYLPSPSAPAAPEPVPVEAITPISRILADTRGHDKRILCVSGPTSVLFQKTSRKGNRYHTFFIHEGPLKLKIFSFGEPAFREGEDVEACGRFDHEKRVSGRLFRNELSAECVLKGKAIAAGFVALTPNGVLPVKH